MSVQSEIDRIKGNVNGAYAAVFDLGGTLPQQQTSANLEAAIRSIPSGGGSPSTPPDPVEVYNATRPADWLPIPEPQDDEMYLLFHIPDGVSSLLAFTVTCTGSYTVALGTVANGQFIQQSAVSVTSGTKYEAELFAGDFGDLTSDGFKQVMVKVSGTDILTWGPSTHSKKYNPSGFRNWNVMEIACRLPKGINVPFGLGSSGSSSLAKLRYFAWYGENSASDMEGRFKNCSSLIAVLYLDTSKVTNMKAMFYYCFALMAIPQLNTLQVMSMNNMFRNCSSLTTIPQLDTSKVTDMANMFYNCQSLKRVPQLDTSNVTTMDSMFRSCSALTVVQQLDTAEAAVMDNMFYICSALNKVVFNPQTANWAGVDISLSGCCLGRQALVSLFISLPTITSAKTLTITGNPGCNDLTSEEKAIITNKNWTLKL